MARVLAAVAVCIVGATTIAGTQERRPAPGSDYFAGAWMLNPAKTVGWAGRDNTTFEYIQYKIENDVHEREVELAYGVADDQGIQKHTRRRNSVRYNEFDPAKANAVDVGLVGYGPPGSPIKGGYSDDHLVTIKVSDRTHVGFNKSGGGYFRHMTPDLKEYVYVGFGADGKVPLHRWSARVKRAGDANIPEPASRPH
jgi:hypothetical protein